MTQVCDTFSRTTSGDWGTSEIPNAVWEQQRGTLSTDGSKAIAITNGTFNRATSNLSFSGVPYSSGDFPIEFRFKTIWPSGSGFLEIDFSPTTNPFDLVVSKAAASTTVTASIEGGSDTPVITGFAGGQVNVHLVVTDTQTTLAVWTTGSEPAPQITQSHSSGNYSPSNWDFLSLTFFGSSASDEFDTDDFCIIYGPSVVTHTQTFTLDAVVAGLGPPVNPPITPSTVSIHVAGNDITDAVIYADAEFTAAANGQAGTCHFRVRDLTHVSSFTTGAPITLDINSVREWTGYLMQIKRGYFFDVEDTKCRCHSVPRYFEIIGSDLNVLFEKRFLYDKATPTKIDLTHFPADTPDQTIIEYYAANHLDLSGDALDTTSLVQHVGTPSTDNDISAAASWSWEQLMTFLNFNIGAIFYLNPDRKLVWADDETESAPFVISDRPAGGQVGYSEYEELLNGSDLINDALVWGAGQGSQSVVFSRSTDATSVATHGRWQVGTGLLPIFKQTTADRTSSTYVYGSPQHHRGHKDDAVGIKCAVYRSGLRVAQVVRVISTVFGTDLTLPIRTCRITFLTQTKPKWELGIATQYDMPWMGFDFFPFQFNLPTFPPFQFPPFDFIPPPPPANPCGAIIPTCAWSITQDGVFSAEVDGGAGVTGTYGFLRRAVGDSGGFNSVAEMDNLTNFETADTWSMLLKFRIDTNMNPGIGTNYTFDAAAWSISGTSYASVDWIKNYANPSQSRMILHSYDGGFNTQYGDFDLSLNSWYWVRFEYDIPGNVTHFRWWVDGDSEPSTWTMEQVSGDYRNSLALSDEFFGVALSGNSTFNGDSGNGHYLGTGWDSTTFTIGSQTISDAFSRTVAKSYNNGPAPLWGDPCEGGSGGVCTDCGWGGFLPADPYQYAVLNTPLRCWPYDFSAQLTVPGNTDGNGTSGGWAEVGIDAASPPAFNSTLSIRLSARISGGAFGGDIPVGTPFCQIDSINGQPLSPDNSLYAVPGTIGVSGPYDVLVEMVPYDNGTSHRIHYYFDGVLNPNLDAADPQTLGGAYHSVYTYTFDTEFAFGSAAVSNIFLSGCSTGDCTDPNNGYACLNLTHIDPPQGSNTTYLYYSMGGSYQPGTSSVRYDGLFLRYLLDYTEDYVNGLVIITNAAINEAYGQNLDQTHVVYGCAFFTPIAIG